MDHHRYVLGGVVVHSDLPLPSVPEAPPPEGGAGAAAGPGPATAKASPGDQVGPRVCLVTALRADRVVDRVAGWLVERRLPGETVPYLQVGGEPALYLLAHHTGLELEVLEGTRVVVTRLPAALDPAELEHILLDQLLPLILGRLGRLSLHASAVADDAGAVAFVGASGTGKSTLSAASVAHGAMRFVADDEVVLEPTTGGFLVHPSYPSVRLWGDSAHVLFGRDHDATHKHRVPLSTIPTATPLRLVVVLERGARVAVARLRPREALVGIAPHVDRLDPTDRVALRAELDLLSQLAGSVRCVRLSIPDDLARLEEAAAAVRAALEDTPR